MLIGVSGKIGSGKDLVGEIIRFLDLYYNPRAFDGTLSTIKTWRNQMTDIQFVMELLKPCYKESNMTIKLPTFIIKKFADKLKDIVCLLIGCTREQLEDREFKNTPLGEEWWKYKTGHYSIGKYNGIFSSYKEAYDFLLNQGLTELDIIEYDKYFEGERSSIECLKFTPRTLLQTLGTECGRHIIHPNIWVNATMIEYKPMMEFYDSVMYPDRIEKGKKIGEEGFPNWVITDVRFPNEAKAIKSKDGITIRINRFEVGQIVWWEDPDNISSDFYTIDNLLDDFCEISNEHSEAQVPYNELKVHYKNSHESETALDDYKFDYVIENNSTIDDLIEKVKEILIKEKII